MIDPAAGYTWSKRREVVVLAVASVFAGVGALVFILVGTRSLGLDNFAPVSHLWTLWAISYSVVTFSTQQAVIRGHRSGQKLRWTSIVLPALVTSAVATPVFILRSQQLFASTSVWWPLAGAVIPFGSLVTGFARGKLAAQGDTSGLAIVVGGENALRALIAVLFMALELEAVWFPLAIIGGFVAAGVGLVRKAVLSPDVEGTNGLTTTGTDVRLNIAASVAGLCSHVVLVLAPSLLALSAVPPHRVSAVFIVLALFRAPYQLILGLGPRLSREMIHRLPSLQIGKLRQVSTRFIGVTTLVAVILAVPAGLVGDGLISPMFQLETLLQPADHSLAAVLTIFAIASIVLTMALYALEEATTLLVIWPMLTITGLGIVSVLAPGVTGALTVLLLTELMIAVSLTIGMRRAKVPRLE